MTLALSTSWIGAGHPTVEATIRAGKAAGFDAFELGVPGDMPGADTLSALADELAIHFTSVHNIAAVPGLSEDEKRGDGLSSADAKVRHRAVEGTVKTVELARTVGARFVVVHAGDVEIADGTEKQAHARRLIEEGRRHEAVAFMTRALAERSTLAPRYVETAAASLAEVFRRTGDFPLALECRVHYWSIPLPGELDFLRRVLSSRPVYYWHDTGHARVEEMLGLVPAEAWLEKFAGILAGIHFHDVSVMSDHEPPGAGEVDFAALKRYLKSDTVRVLELHARTGPAELTAAKRYLEELGLA